MRSVVSVWLAALAVVSAIVPAASAVEVSHVYHEPTRPIDWSSEEARIHFRLSRPARVTVSFFDGRNLRVGAVSPGEVLSRGDHVLTWDGRDEKGRRVPDEAYVYTITARSADGRTAEWDLTDLSGHETLSPREVRWDPKAGVVRYALSDPARVRIRIGLQNDGPLLKTLIDWVPRAAGPHAEKWDGRDASEMLDLARHPELAVQVEAFSLPSNTLLTGAAPGRVELIADLPEPRVERERKAKARRRMFDYAHQPIESRRDFPALLELPAGLARNADGLPVVTGPVPVRVSVEDADLEPLLNERCEAVFYVDGRMAFENQVSFLPMTWTWDPGNASGVHYLTANLRGYEGHFGIQTLKVYVDPTGSAN